MQTAVDVIFMLTFVDELILQRVLATLDHILVRDVLIHEQSAKDGAAFHKGPVGT